MMAIIKRRHRGWANPATPTGGGAMTKRQCLGAENSAGAARGVE